MVATWGLPRVALLSLTGKDNMNNPTLPLRGAAIAILVSAFASIAAVAMDSMAGGKDALAVMQDMIRLQQSHQAVHVVAMACLAGLMFGYTTFSQLLGMHRAPVQVGLVTYAMGSMLMLVATVIDGFIGTDIAVMFAGKSPEAVKAGYWMIQALTGAGLIDIAKVAWVFQSVAVVSWSCALLAQRGLARLAGAVGLLVGALPGVTVLVVGSQMTDMVVVGILLLQAAWNVTAAVLLLRSGRTLRIAASAPGACPVPAA